MNNDDIITRARELAKLAEKATPGRWDADHIRGMICGRDHQVWVANTTSWDLPLISRSPEMAQLIGDLADELDNWRLWARATCKSLCVDLTTRGHHAPNCPVADMGLDHEKSQPD